MKLSAATIIALTMIAAPALADPPTVSTTCAIAPLSTQQQAVIEHQLGNPATIPGNIGGLNQLVKGNQAAQQAGFNNTPQLAKAFGISPSQINAVLHDCRNMPN